MHSLTLRLSFLTIAFLPLGWAQTAVLRNHNKSVYQRIDVGGRVWLFEDVNGRAVVEGDMVLGQVLSLKRGAKNGRRDASIVNGHRWPNGEVPYLIDKTNADNPNLEGIVQQAIRHWEDRTPFHFVPRDTQTDYLVFQSQPGGCWSDVGMQGGPQPVNLSNVCFVGQAIHAIGHSVGLFHEQSRHDRDDFIQVRQEQVILAHWDPDFIIQPEGIDTGYYDYGSIMHYNATEFSITCQDPETTACASAISTIPPGIPIGQRAGLSPGDVAAAGTLNGLTQKEFVVTTDPEGLEVTVDGWRCLAPCVFNWSAGSQHKVEAPTPQPALSQGLRLPPWQWYFARWNDDGARAHDITVAAEHPVLTANFSQTAPETLPDLAVTALTAPVSAATGEALAGLHAQIENLGPEAAGSFRLGFFVSPGEKVIRDHPLGYCYFRGLNAGAAAVCDGDPYCHVVGDSAAVAPCEGDFKVPADLPPGNYYIGAIADDSFQVGEGSEKNNALANQAGATAITSSAPGSADLEVVSFSAAVKGIIGGSIGQVRAEVRNRGVGAAGPFRVGYYLAKTQNIETDGIYTKWSCTEDHGLQPGESRVCTGDIEVRSDLVPGTYYLAVKVDDLNQVAEADETNNIRLNALGPVELTKVDRSAPDLVAVAFRAPTAATAGGAFSGVWVRVQNTGLTRSGQFRVGIYVSGDPVISTADVHIASCTSNGLAPRAVFDCAGTIPVPVALPAGTYYLGAVVDDQNQVAEVNEDNNTRVNDAGATVLSAHQ